MGEAVADVSVELLINGTDVIQSKAFGGFTTDEMKSAFDILTGNYFKQDTSKSSNPELNDNVVEAGTSQGIINYSLTYEDETFSTFPQLMGFTQFISGFQQNTDNEYQFFYRS
jgi:hypothetical protein